MASLFFTDGSLVMSLADVLLRKVVFHWREGEFELCHVVPSFCIIIIPILKFSNDQIRGQSNDIIKYCKGVTS